MDHYTILDSVSAFRRMVRDASQADLEKAAQELAHQLNNEPQSRPDACEPLNYLSATLMAELRWRYNHT